MDFNYHIQNFSAIAYAKVVKPKQQATVAYSFVPADAFAGRPIGLTINLQYRDAAGNFFIDPVFNETVQIVEFDEGFDTETFFLYVTMAGSVILLLFLGYNFIAGTIYRYCTPHTAACQCYYFLEICLLLNCWLGYRGTFSLIIRHFT